MTAKAITAKLVTAKSATARASVLAKVVPFPADLLDSIMPILKDTEWRILCVVVRQTLGWQADAKTGRRKAADWLTQSQLKKRTGRASAALSEALDGLVRRGLIDVCDDTGKRLATPSQRRRYHGRAFFRLGEKARCYVHSPAPSKTSQSEFRPSSSTSQSELHKANTTKETHDKITPYGGSQRGTLRWSRRGSAEGQLTARDLTQRHPDRRPDPQQKKILEKKTLSKGLLTRERSNTKLKIGNPAARTGNPDVRRFLHNYIETFRQHTASGDPPPLAWGKDGRLVKDLLGLYTYDRLAELLEQFFASDDKWIRELGYSLGAFRAAIGKLLISEQVTTLYRRDPRSGEWVKTTMSGPNIGHAPINEDSHDN